MKNKIIKLSHQIRLDAERIKVLSDIIFEKDNVGAEIYVPAHFINECSIKVIDDINIIEDIMLNEF